MEQDTGRALWLAERRRGLGGTDAAAIVGASKWATEFDVWMEKVNDLPQKSDTDLMWWGRALEDVIARRYVETTGRKVWAPGRVMAHADFPELIGSPDRLVLGEQRGLEVKTASLQTAGEWGPDGSDVMPEAYVVQVAHYMAITGFDKWDVAVLLGGNDFRVYTVQRDREFEDWLVNRCVGWWQEHVVGGRQPFITGAKSTSDVLARRWQRDTGELLDRSADGYATTYRDRYLQARKERQRLEALEDEAANNLKALIGEAAGLKFGDGSTVTWKAARDTEVVDWRAAFERLAELAAAAGVQADGVVADATSRRAGSRRFLYRPAKD